MPCAREKRMGPRLRASTRSAQAASTGGLCGSSRNSLSSAAPQLGALALTVGAAAMQAFRAAAGALADITGREELRWALALSTLFAAQGAPCALLLPAATLAMSCNTPVAAHTDGLDAGGTLIGWFAAGTEARDRPRKRSDARGLMLWGVARGPCPPAWAARQQRRAPVTPRRPRHAKRA
jgi:hypothetical protein